MTETRKELSGFYDWLRKTGKLWNQPLILMLDLYDEYHNMEPEAPPKPEIEEMPQYHKPKMK